MVRYSAYVTIRERPDGSLVDANKYRNWIKFKCKSTHSAKNAGIFFPELAILP